MPNQKQFSQTYYDKANEEEAFRDYAPFRYGKVEQDPTVAAYRFLFWPRSACDP